LSLTPTRSEALALFGQKGAFCKGLRKIPAVLNAQFKALLAKNKIPQRFH